MMLHVQGLINCLTLNFIEISTSGIVIGYNLIVMMEITYININKNLTCVCSCISVSNLCFVFNF